MSLKGCHHLQTFKKNHENLESLKRKHAVFVLGNDLKTKICNSFCRTCKKTGPFLHACLECIFMGCHKHIREHMKNQTHVISMELTYGQIHCSSCCDYIYDFEIDKITMDNRMRSGKSKKRLLECTSWDAAEEERNSLHIKKKSKIGLKGLLDLGKTDFMNCIIQVLMHTPLLRAYFFTEKHCCNQNSTKCLLCMFSRLFQDFHRGGSTPLALHELLYSIWTQAMHLANSEQQDAHEFFLAMLHMLHEHCFHVMPKISNLEEKNKNKCPCVIDHIFTGCLQSEIVCQQCKTVSTALDPIMDLSLDLGPVAIDGSQPSSLNNCLERFTSVEHLNSHEKILCSNCGSEQKFTKQLTMKTLPVVISFHLKRIQYLGMEIIKWQRNLPSSSELFLQIQSKISTAISFPELLDMTPFMSKTNSESPVPSDNTYTLFAVVNHLGNSIDVGHYIAFVKKQHDSWYKCDNHVITRTNLKDVLDSEA